MKGKQKRQAVALFRYGVIAPVLHAAAGSQARYFGRMARKELDVPGLGRRRYSVATFKSWLRRYRQEGLDGLLPKRRCDAGRSRVISEQLSAHISELLARHPRVPVNRLREQLVASGHITSRRISESTLRRHIKRAGLRPQVKPAPKARKHFEKPHANDLWVMDFMHGPKVPLGRRRRKTYLAAAIDDHSRFLTLARFYTRENSAVVVSALQKAFSRHGLSQILYCDNGSAFSSKQLTLACARLGVALVHSKPYDSPSRGKIERWFRTLRQGFLSLLDLEALTLDDLNARLSQWLEQDYHRRRHSSICETPLERYLRSLASIRRRTVSRAELDRVFYRTLHRTVRNDSPSPSPAGSGKCRPNTLACASRSAIPKDVPVSCFSSKTTSRWCVCTGSTPPKTPLPPEDPVFPFPTRRMNRDPHFLRLLRHSLRQGHPGPETAPHCGL